MSATETYNLQNSVTVTTTYSALKADDRINADATGAGFTITLPQISGLSGVGIGFQTKAYYIVKTDATGNIVNVAPYSGDTVNGSSSLTLRGKNDFVLLVSDPSGDWKISDETVLLVTNGILFSGSNPKILDFSGVVPAFGSQEDGFISIGTYGTPMTINDTGATFVPVNVSLSSTGNAASAGNQVAAARLRVNAATNNQGNTAIACLQLCSDLSVNVNAVAQLSQSVNLSGNVVLNQGEFWLIFAQSTGAGNISGSTGEPPSILGCRIAGTGTGFGYVAVLEVNSVCTTAGVLKLSANPGATVPSFINFVGTNTALVKTGTATGTVVQVTIAINGTQYYLNAYPTQN